MNCLEYLKEKAEGMSQLPSVILCVQIREREREGIMRKIKMTAINYCFFIYWRGVKSDLQKTMHINFLLLSAH